MTGPDQNTRRLLIVRMPLVRQGLKMHPSASAIAQGRPSYSMR